MIALVITLIVIVAVLLVLLVLAQDPKTGGFQSGAGATQLMGVKKTTDLLERLTWGFVIGVFVLSISTSFIVSTGGDDQGINSVNIERARQSNAVQPAQQPAAGAKENAQPAQPQVNQAQDVPNDRKDPTKKDGK